MCIRDSYGLLHDINLCHGVSYLWRTDCHMAGNKRCYFCGRLRLGSGVREPAHVWAELRQARDTWGIRQFYNVADSVAVNEPDFRAFVEAQPEDFGTEIHRCFINSHQVNTDTIPLLTRLNAIVSMGIESYALFDKVGKRLATTRTNEDAVRELDKADIPMVLSFVFGLPGEDAAKISRTGRYIQHLVDRHSNVVSIEMSPLTVTSGSRAYEDLMEMEAEHFAKRIPPYDVVELSERYFESFCRISRGQVIQVIADLAGRIVTARPNVFVDVKGLSLDEKQRLFGSRLLQQHPYRGNFTPTERFGRRREC